MRICGVLQTRYNPIKTLTIALTIAAFSALFLDYSRNKKIRDTTAFGSIPKHFGGDKRDRTADLLNAIQALSQLSYTPRYLSRSRTAAALPPTWREHATDSRRIAGLQLSLHFL